MLRKRVFDCVKHASKRRQVACFRHFSENNDVDEYPSGKNSNILYLVA